MDITIKEVRTRKDLNIFIHLPAHIHKNHKNWVPPIYMDERVFFNPRKNKSFAHSDTIMLLAFHNNLAVGRIMGIINHQYNSNENLKEARFIFLETYNDFTVAQQLIQEIEKWAIGKKMTKLVGPLGFSDKDPQGLMIEGFENSPVIATNYNFEYLVEFVEKAGFSKKIDLLVYKINVPEEFPEIYERISNRAIHNNSKLHVVKFRNRIQMQSYIKPVFELINRAYKDIYAFTPLDETEMNELARRYLPILDPHYVKVIEKGHKEIIAFVLAIPDISEGIRQCKGRVLPLGIFQILRSQKKTKQLDLLLGAIREDYRNAGIDTILAKEIFGQAKKAKIEFIDSHLVLENNVKMRSEFEKMGGKMYKKYRIFQKDLL